MGVWLVIIITMVYRISVLNANYEDLDQMPHFVAADIGLQSLPRDARHKLVKKFHISRKQD